jgi:hypothetical protein
MAAVHGQAWADEEEQELRPYVVTRGRTRPRHPMRLETLLAVGRTAPPGDLVPEARAALELCRDERHTVAEIAAQVRKPVQVVKIILSDLLDTGALVVALPSNSDPSNPQILEAFLAGLRKRFPEVA